MCDLIEDFKLCLKEHPEEFSKVVFEAWCKWFVDSLNRENLSTGKDRLTLAMETISGKKENNYIITEEVRERFEDIIRAMFAPEEPPAFSLGPLGESLDRRRQESVV